MEIINPIIVEIMRRAKLRGYDNPTALAKAAGLSGTTLTKKAKEPNGGPNTETLIKLAKFLDCSPSDFVTPVAKVKDQATIHGEVRPASARVPALPHMRKDLPVMGTVAGAVVNNGFEITNQVVETIHRPPALDGSPAAYALRVIGVSMEPLYRGGDLVIAHPYRPYRRGDSVILQVRTHDGGPICGYIKTFRRETDDAVICEQFNPVAEVAFMKTTVISIHKVLTLAELLGA